MKWDELLDAHTDGTMILAAIWNNGWLRWGLGAAGLLIILLIALLVGGGASGGDLPSYPVKRGDFVVSITETGELRAKNSIVVRAPRVRSNLQVVSLAEKGSIADKGDTLVVFDGTELQQRIDERRNELEKALANLEKSKSSMASTMADLEASLKSAEASYRQAELRLQQMQFEAEVVKEEQELALEQAEIQLEQAEKRIEQQKIINHAELRTLELNVKQARMSLEQAKRELGELTITAPQPGLVVYMKIWNGSNRSELKVGDTPWRGQGLIELPDLNVMVGETSVNEIDVSRVEKGQSARVVPDAFPDRIYPGTVVEVARLARIDEEREAEVKVFDVTIQLDEVDDVLKPGMTVSSTIIVQEVPDTLYIPLDAVFTENRRPTVFRANAGYRRTPVELGVRNDNFVVVASGLTADDRVSLVDPNVGFDPTTWTGLDEDADAGAATVMQNNGDGS